RLLLTNEHVVGAASEVVVFFPTAENGSLVTDPAYYVKKVTALHGRVVARDARRDLALIQLPALPGGVVALPLAGQSARPGQTVHSIGTSGADHGTLWSYTRGEVRAVHAIRLTDETTQREFQSLETQSPTNHGDSGGPMVNDRSELVGVVESYDPQSREVSY